MADEPQVRTAVHGTAAGFRSGCRSQGGCPNHRSSRYLTCAEADIARHSDYAFSRLPTDAPVPRRTWARSPSQRGGALSPRVRLISWCHFPRGSRRR